MCDSISGIPQDHQDRSEANMKTIDEMLHLALLTPDEHQQISRWIAQADSPDEILKMPPLLWRAVERASAVMEIDEDLMRPPALDADDLVCG
jgi:hypothetical protein